MADERGNIAVSQRVLGKYQSLLPLWPRYTQPIANKYQNTHETSIQLYYTEAVS